MLMAGIQDALWEGMSLLTVSGVTQGRDLCDFITPTSGHWCWLLAGTSHLSTGAPSTWPFHIFLHVDWFDLPHGVAAGLPKRVSHNTRTEHDTLIRPSLWSHATLLPPDAAGQGLGNDPPRLAGGNIRVKAPEDCQEGENIAATILGKVQPDIAALTGMKENYIHNIVILLGKKQLSFLNTIFRKNTSS